MQISHTFFINIVKTRLQIRLLWWWHYEEEEEEEDEERQALAV